MVGSVYAGQQGIDRSPSILPPALAKSTAGGLEGRTQVQDPFGRGQISLRLYIILYVELRGKNREVCEVNCADLTDIVFLRGRKRKGRVRADYSSTSRIRNSGIYYLDRNGRTWLMPLTLLPDDALRSGMEYGHEHRWSEARRSLSMESGNEWTWRDAIKCKTQNMYTYVYSAAHKSKNHTCVGCVSSVCLNVFRSRNHVGINREKESWFSLSVILVEIMLLGYIIVLHFPLVIFIVLAHLAYVKSLLASFIEWRCHFREAQVCPRVASSRGLKATSAAARSSNLPSRF